MASEQSEVVRVRGNSTTGFIMNIGKKCLRNHGAVEYHAVGVAMSTACMAAERLMRFQYANLIRLETVRVEGNRSKVIVRLGKAPTFEQAEKQFEEERETANAQPAK